MAHITQEHPASGANFAQNSRRQKDTGDTHQVEPKSIADKLGILVFVTKRFNQHLQARITTCLQPCTGPGGFGGRECPTQSWLGRRSNLPAIRTFCTIYVELIRGVPLVSVLFMASFMFPLFMPQGFTIDVLIRVLVGITLFAAAYMAEVIRGGLQAIPKGQIEAAATLGLSYWQTQRKIVLPQALAMVVPSIMNNFIGLFKDTSLVTIVSLYELTGALALAVNSDANWRPFKVEGYIFIAMIYFLFCFSMSRYSIWVEKQVNKGKAR